jgi:hypothetical protein
MSAKQPIASSGHRSSTQRVASGASTDSPGARTPWVARSRPAAASLQAGESVLAPLATRCVDDRWPEEAIGCFADMLPDDLGKCASTLEVPARDALFAVLAGHGASPPTVAIVLARLAALDIGIADCERFVSAVASALQCEQVPLDARLALGNETADFWSLSTGKLPADAQDQIGQACGAALVALEREIGSVGCTL